MMEKRMSFLQERFARMLNSKSVISVMALMIGSSVWFMTRVDMPQTREIAVPICFYDVGDAAIESENEHAQLVVQGPRSALHEMAYKDMAIHVNVGEFDEGDKELYVLDQKIFLPDEVKLVHCNPHVIKVTKKKPNAA